MDQAICEGRALHDHGHRGRRDHRVSLLYGHLLRVHVRHAHLLCGHLLRVHVRHALVLCGHLLSVHVRHYILVCREVVVFIVFK